MIYCIGRNYAKHAKELGNAVPQGAPVVFFKPPASVALSGETIKLPAYSKEVHFELELAFKFNEKLEVGEIAVANDLTARDKQREAQEKKTPWSLAKGFKKSCGLGNWASSKNIDLHNLEMRLTLNGQTKQHGFTKDMLFTIPVIIDYLKENFPVEPGDIVLTGTPEGVGPVVSGDVIDAEIIGLSKAQWKFI